MLKFTPNKSWLTVSLIATLLANLAGCASHKPPAIDQAKVNQFQAQGYPVLHEFDDAQSEELRLVKGQPAHLVWNRPVDAKPHPLVIYLPGLGQDAHALERMKRAMARSGYVVLSWQPLPEDDRSPPGSDQTSCAKTRFSTTYLQQRGAMLSSLMEDLTRSKNQGDKSLQSVDLQHVGLMGFDLGAYTVMYAAGELLNDEPQGTVRPQFNAYIAISPYASFELGAFDTRYKNIAGPVLSITSDADTDSFGVMTAPFLHTVAQAGMPTGDKYLLLLRGAQHATLGEGSNTDLPPHAEADSAHGNEQTPERTGTTPAKGRGRGKGGRNTGDGEHKREGDSSAQDRSPTAQVMQQTAETQVAIAFLDAYLNVDPLAHQWLASQAPKWLTKVGDLIIK